MPRPLESPQEQNARDDLADAVWKMPKLPRGTPRIDRLRWIVHHKTAAKTEGVMVDLFTASMLVQVYDNLSEENRAKFIALPITRMASVGWEVLKRVQG
jgi:hypothetical protein